MDISKLPRLSQTQDVAEKPATQAGESEAKAATVVCPHCRGVMPANSKFCNDCGARLGSAVADPGTMPDVGMGGEAWLSAIIGLVFIFLGRTFGAFLIAKLTGHAFHTEVLWPSGENAGSEVDYFSLQGFQAISDMGIFLFGVVLLLEALVLTVQSMSGRRRPILLMAAVGVTFFTTVFNIYVVVKLMSVGVTPLVSLLAIAFGGYIGFIEWKMLQSGKVRGA